MEGVAIIFGLLALAVVIGSVLGWVAMAKLGRVTETLSQLQARLQSVERELRDARRRPAEPIHEQRTSTALPPQAAAEPTPEPRTAQPHPAQASTPDPASGPAARFPSSDPPTSKASAPPAEPAFTDVLIDNMRRNWMAWLGGISVALAGIFLVGYGIEMGYLGPRARIIAAVLAGIVLHAAAEYFRRKTRQAHQAFAALAGGASITLYAALYAALELYQLMSPGLTFTLLAVVSLATMALTTVHGPLLAAIGILGAYFVPMLVPGTGFATVADLGYSLVVTSAALLLIRFVYRPWLWYGMLTGALGWWLISLDQSAADGYRGYYLAAFTYLALAVPVSDWLLRRKPQAADPAMEIVGGNARWPVPALLLTVVLIALAQAASIAHLGFTGFAQSLLLWSPLTIVVFLALRSRDELAVVPWILLVTQLAAWLISPDLWSNADRLVFGFLDPAVKRGFFGFTLAMAVLFSAGSWLANRHRPYTHIAASLIWLAPLLWLALAYLRIEELSQSWQWAAATLALGLTYIGLAGRRLDRRKDDASTIWLLLGGHVAWSLAAAMLFREATLTLALAAQLISLAWLHRRFALPALPWLIKGVLALVVVRLTLNPWLKTYPADVHWSLWTYGGATLCCFIASRLASTTLGIRAWLEAAGLHLLVLFLGAETRYWLYDGRIFVNEFTLTEAAIDAALWGGLALTYFNRARFGQQLADFYALCSRILFVLALGAYGLALTVLNPLFGNEPIAATKLWNILLLAYGAPVLIAVAARFFYESRFRDFAATVAGVGLFIFVSLQIRHLWHGALDLNLGFTNPEVYTYSAAWLLMAVCTMLGSTRLGATRGYRAGTGLLLVVIAKIFLYDMAGLEGLLRVASFMGLGLALLGLAWLYQHTAREITSTR